MYTIKDFYMQNGEGQKCCISKEQIVCGKVTTLGVAGVYQAAYLTSADQVIPD